MSITGALTTPDYLEWDGIVSGNVVDDTTNLDETKVTITINGVDFTYSGGGLTFWGQTWSNGREGDGTLDKKNLTFTTVGSWWDGGFESGTITVVLKHDTDTLDTHTVKLIAPQMDGGTVGDLADAFYYSSASWITANPSCAYYHVVDYQLFRANADLQFSIIEAPIAYANLYWKAAHWLAHRNSVSLTFGLPVNLRTPASMVLLGRLRLEVPMSMTFQGYAFARNPVSLTYAEITRSGLVPVSLTFGIPTTLRTPASLTWYEVNRYNSFEIHRLSDYVKAVFQELGITLE